MSSSTIPASSGAKSAAVEVGKSRFELLLEVGRARSAERVVRRVRALNRGEVQPELGEIGGQVDRLQVEAGSPAGERPGRDRDLRVRPVALRQVRNRLGAVLRVCGGDDEHAVVVDRAVVGGVVDVDVPGAVRREAGVVVREGGLLRRAEGAGDVRPAGRVSQRHALVLDAEGVRAGGLAGKVVVENDAAAPEETAEVDDGALKRRHEPARADPLHRDDRLAAPLGRLRDVVGLEDSRSSQSWWSC